MTGVQTCALPIYYLANKENNLYFALVGDYKDADEKDMPQDEAITGAALAGICKLNKQYASEGREIFFYFHRHRQFNANQNKWMGWERKRGAIVEFNQLIRGSTETSYSITSCNPSDIPRLRYIITLDADTNLPMNSARKLVGAISHPLNRAVVEDGKKCVVRG